MRTFKQSLQSDDFVFTAELVLRDGDGELEIRERAAALLQGSFSAIQVTDIPTQPNRISELAAAMILLRSGVDAIPEVNGRDRNRIALMSDLLGYRALGINSIVCGAPGETVQPPVAPKPKTPALSRGEVIAIAESLNQDESVRPGEEFLIGAAVTIDPARPDATVNEIHELSRAGVRLLQIEPCFDSDLLRQFMQMMVEARLTWTCAVMITLAPLPSAEAARRFRDERPGVLIPDSVLDRLASAPVPATEGIAICSEQIRTARSIPGVAGVRLVCLNDPLHVNETILASQT